MRPFRLSTIFEQVPLFLKGTDTIKEVFFNVIVRRCQGATSEGGGLIKAVRPVFIRVFICFYRMFKVLLIQFS